MELIFANEEFTVQGFSYPGFPVLLDKDMKIVEEALDFLLYHCLQRGRVQSKGSWETFGRDLYDFMAFVEANNLDWRKVNTRLDSHILAVYRDWSLEECGLAPSTINRRLGLAIKFYQFALRQEWVQNLPYDIESIRVSQPEGFLAHTDRSGGVKASPDVMLKTPRTRIKILNAEQIKQLLIAINPKASIEKKTLSLMVRLCLLTGLRKEECLTFPVSYLINPSAMPVSSHYVVTLSPRAMEVKGEVERSIHIPVTLMRDLWEYKLHERGDLHNRSEGKHGTMFLNTHGKPFSTDANTFNKKLKDLKLPFRVGPHMLRHCYATHTLKSLMKRKSLTFNPLLYVRDRLGHASITTTEKYLHFLDDIEDDLVTEYQREIDQICDEAAAA